MMMKDTMILYIIRRVCIHTSRTHVYIHTKTDCRRSLRYRRATRISLLHLKPPDTRDKVEHITVLPLLHLFLTPSKTHTHTFLYSSAHIRVYATARFIARSEAPSRNKPKDLSSLSLPSFLPQPHPQLFIHLFLSLRRRHQARQAFNCKEKEASLI